MSESNEGLPTTPAGPVSLEVRRDVASGLLTLAQGVLLGQIDGIKVEWDGGPLCRIAAHRTESPLVVPADGLTFNQMKARG